MKYITYTTEKAINRIKAIPLFEQTLLQMVVVSVYDRMFSECHYYGATLKEFENYLGNRLNNKIESKGPD